MKLRTASGHRILVDEALSTDFDIPLSGGETGPAGVTGSPGVTGVSAYESAIDNGFQGDIVSWLTSLKGDPGNDGSPGATGQQGVAGSPGSTGPQGLVGATGIQGVTGSQGITGIPGVTGIQGVTGVQGVTGSPGVTGAPGVGGGSSLDAWPVGSVYIAVDSTSPATRFGGGTWAAFGAGRVLVGLNGADSDFDTAEETGGAKTVTLTAAQSGLPQHTHTQNAHTHVQNAHTHTISGGSSDDTSAPFTGPDASTSTATAFGGGIGSTTAVNQNATATNQNAGPTDASQAHTNLQPYIVVYMWKRTA